MRKSSWKQEEPGWRAGNQTTSVSLIIGIVCIVWNLETPEITRKREFGVLMRMQFEKDGNLYFVEISVWREGCWWGKGMRCGWVVDRVRIGCGCAAVGTEVWRTSWIRPARSHRRFHTQAPAENFSLLYSWDSRILAGCAGQISPCLLCNSPLCPPKKLFFSPPLGHLEHTLPVSGVKNHPDFFFLQKLPCAFIPTFFPPAVSSFSFLGGVW